MHDERIEHLRKARDRMAEMERFGGLRSWIIYVLKEGPKNGVEIMDAIQSLGKSDRRMMALDQRLRDHGHHHGPEMGGMEVWRPSPGSIYPMLGKMVAEGLIIKREDRQYELTDTGHEAFNQLFGQPEARRSLERGPYSVENVLSEMDSYASYLEDVKKEKLSPHKDIIREIVEKLTRVQESLEG